VKLKKGIEQLVAEANAAIETVTVAQVKQLRADPGVQLVDVRDVRELWREGGIPGALHVPRGLLEFWVDPESPYHKPIFASGKRFIFFCAGGLRSALAAKAVSDMGLATVAHMAGGFGAWRESGGEIEKVEPRR
jgi:rhodanese-related sulfurtransferase